MSEPREGFGENDTCCSKNAKGKNWPSFAASIHYHLSSNQEAKFFISLSLSSSSFAQPKVNLAKEDLVAVFHLPVAEASKRLGLGTTALKRVCRQYNVKRWPYRKIVSNIRKANRAERKENEVAFLNSLKHEKIPNKDLTEVLGKELHELSRDVLLSTLSTGKQQWADCSHETERKMLDEGDKSRFLPATTPCLQHSYADLGKSDTILRDVEVLASGDVVNGEVGDKILGLLGLKSGDEELEMEWLLNYFCADKCSDRGGNNKDLH